MIVVSDEEMAFCVLADMHPDDPLFQRTAAGEAKARAAAIEAVRRAIHVTGRPYQGNPFLLIHLDGPCVDRRPL